MRAPFTHQEFTGNVFKNFLRNLSLLVTLAASLAMAQQGTSSATHPDAQQPDSGASKWGPARNPTPSAAPHASTPASTRTPHSVQEQPSSTRGVTTKQEAPPPAHSAGTALPAEEAAASSGETTGLASRSTAHSSGNSRGSKSKSHTTALNSRKENRERRMGSAGIHPHAKPGVHKTKKRVTW